MACIAAIILSSFRAAAAFETDQYDLPPKPLADIGDEVTEHVEQKIGRALEKINAEILRRQQCVETDRAGDSCGSPKEESAKLAELRSDDAIVREVYKQLGAGVPPFTSMGTWMDSHHFQGKPARYRTSYLKSIFLFLPPICFTISPTVNLYGSEFGTDKIAHFFQQGYTYYKIYRQAMDDGSAPNEAEHKAVRWGQKSENTFYGTLVAGVYSNGDLFANYVGMKFYLGLTREIRIGETTRPPILVLNNGVWILNQRTSLSESLIKPFMSDQLNEALNPSIFTEFLGLRSWVRRSIRRRSCKQWFEKYPGLSQPALEQKSLSLRVWYGEDYGFTDSKNFVTIANTCFAEAR
jgi:hypothetical protein